MAKKCTKGNSCGDSCIEKTDACNVGLTPSTAEASNKLISLIKDIKKVSLDFNSNKPIADRMISNGKQFIDAVAGIQNLKGLSSMIRDSAEELGNEERKRLQGLRDILIEIEGRPEKQRLIELAQKYEKISNKKINMESIISKNLNIPKDQVKDKLKSLDRITNALKKRSGVTAKKAREQIDIQGQDVSEDVIEAYRILGLKSKITVVSEEENKRASASAGFHINDISKIKEINNPSEARNLSNNIYNKIGGGKIWLGNSDGKSTIFHEMGHHLEFSNRNIAQGNKEWIESRRSGPDKKLNEIVGAIVFDDFEVAAPDDFINPYVGKTYGSNPGLVSTEVTSVGIEHFTDTIDMLRLLKGDEEHFYLTVGNILELQGPK